MSYLKKILLCLIFLTSCAPVGHLERRSQDFVVHTVKYQGENPAIISKWYTGDYNNWQEIKTWNGNCTSNKIIIGDEMRIPVELLTVNSTLPKEFVAKEHRTKYFQVNKKNRAKTTAAVEAQSEEIQSDIQEQQKVEDDLLETLTN